MISARAMLSARLVAALAARARKIGDAAAEERTRAARADPWRWRKARLLWPLFGDQ